MVEATMIISNKMDAQGGESEATERSDDTLSEEEEEEEPSGGANEEERRLLDELEGLEEAEEEEYSGPLLAEQEEEEDEGEAEEDVDEEEARAEAEAEEEGPEEGGVELGVLDFLKRPPEQDEGTPQEQADFSRELEQFFSHRKMDHRTPKFYGENLNLLKLWRTVIRLGAYDYVTAHKLWRQVGETFNPPKKCTTVSWSFRIYYEKSLLDYERHMLHGKGCSSVQGGSPPEMVEGPSGALQNGAAQPQGRARRDAAMRAMQGWHSQRILDNEDVGIANTKDKSSVPIAKRDKQLKMGFLKRKNPSTPERAVKAARLMNRARPYILDDATIKDENGDHGHQSFNPMKRKQGNTKQLFKSSNHNLVNGSDIRVADEGPQADWVKINVHRTSDCFEVYALVPGLLQEELRIQCEPGGHLVIIGEPEQPNNPWGVTPFKKVIKLPSPIDANQTSAVITLHGQLFVRVPYGEAHT